ncbi:hypothetical protein [Micrococcus luteus]|uniref:hypothetical protein n=1 Tax=Micrococcus luteus TaxID=1270 RepID=UPI000E1BF65E|nr:hypothetical protein [Micrococcus luteus]
MSGELREVVEDQGDGLPPLPLGYSEVLVRIETEGGVGYVLTLSESGELEALTIRRPGLTRANLRDVPLRDLQAVAADYRERFHDLHEGEDYPTVLAEELAGWEPGEHTCPHDRAPSLAEFAEQWKAHPKGGRIAGRLHPTRRSYLAALYSIAESTVDSWTRKARAADLLPPPRTGRPKGSAAKPAPQPES